MKRIITYAALTIGLVGCAQHPPQQDSSEVTFVLGNLSSSYQVKVSQGSIEQGRFVEDWFASVDHKLTEDTRYIIGNAKVGSYIAISSTTAHDASGNYLGKFTPCNKTLVFRLPLEANDVYITDINYQWENVAIYPMYADQLEHAQQYFRQHSEFGIGELKPIIHLQLHADLYHDCETLSPHPYALERPI